MTEFTDGLLSTLATDRPSESSLIVHTVGKAKNATGYFGFCSCGGWAMQSEGHDESSRNAINEGMHNHKAGVR